MLRVRWGTLVVVAALFFAISGCGKSGTKMAVSEMTARQVADIQKVDVDVHSFYFKPNRIIVQMGKPVDMTVHFHSWFAPHTLTCIDQDAGVNVDVRTGAFSFGSTKRARFTPTKTGEYEFFCHVDHHAKKGMKGSIVVQ